MRLYNHLNESTPIEDFDHFTELVERDCQPFLRELKKENKIYSMLYSGRRNTEPFFMGKVRKNRTPKDIPEEAHTWFNSFFKKKFGIRARSESLFITGDLGLSKSYGNRSYMIFPIGRYKILWNPEIEDLFEYLRIFHIVDSDNFYKNRITDTLLRIIDEYQYMKDFNEFVISGHEGMLICNEYYAAYHTYRSVTLNWLQNEIGIKSVIKN